MAVYKPLFMYLTPASIPQVVAHIQKYLAENPIVSDPEAIAEAIQKYIEEHPEIIAVASVNGKTGNVVLTGSDIMINPSSAVSVETQLLNLASMINNTGANITQIEANISQIYTNIGTLQTDVETNASNISALQTSVEGQGPRIAAAETDIDNLETAQTAQGTRLNAAEGNISSLQTRMTRAETDIDNNESSIETLQTGIQSIESDINPNHLTNTVVYATGYVTGGGNSLCLFGSISSSEYKQITLTKAVASLRIAGGGYIIAIETNILPYFVRGEINANGIGFYLEFNKSDGWGVPNNSTCCGPMNVTF